MSKYQVYKTFGENGKYTIYQKKLGEGQYGRVFLGFSNDQKIQVAVKIISKQSITDKLSQIQNQQGLEYAEQYRIAILKRLQNEVQQSQKATHDNIVRFIELIESQNNLYLVLEYCECGTLENYIKKSINIQQDIALFYFRQLVAGCKHLYDHSIIHRDIKPANILFYNNNLVKIGDFGFSKAIQEELKNVEQSQTPWIGTPLYMSPQVINQENYSIKTDVWSLGCVLYEMLYGIVPYPYEDFTTLQKKVSTQNVTFPPEPPIKDSIKFLLKKMLERNENKRASIVEVQIELDQLYQL